MITLRKAEDRRHRKRGIHESWMAFDPESRVDPLRHGFHALESLDEENLGPGMRLRAHPRKDVEILTYVHEGVLILQGEAGQLGRQGPGEFQYMSASSAVRHRALNGSSSDTAHVFQSRMTPSLVEFHPDPEQKMFPTADREGILRLVVSRDGRGMSLRSHQDVRLYSSILLQGHHMVHELEGGRCAWLHVVKGTVVIRDLQLRAGDAAAFDGETAVSFTAQEPAEVLLYDLP